VPPGGSMITLYVLQLLVSEKVKNCSNAATTKAREKKISTDLESLEFYNFFDACLAKFKNNQILLIKAYLHVSPTLH
jgi:hypothetical protein